MAINFDLPDTIAVFPLPGALLLPRSRLPLHIFEPRYLSMLEDVLKTPERLIGMIQTSGQKSEERMQSIGCAGRVTQFSETEDGRYMVTLTGISRYRIRDEIEGFTPYRRFDVSWTGFEGDRGATDKDPSFDRASFFKILARYFKARGLSTDWDTLKDADDELLINSLSMLLDFEVEDKQALLEAITVPERIKILTTLVSMAVMGSGGDNLDRQ